MKIAYQTQRFSQASRERIQQANDIIDAYLAQGFSLTLRQLYYQFVSRDLLPNTERSYKNLGKLVSNGRLAGLIDWNAIEDRTRNLQERSHWDSPQEILRAAANGFYLSRWDPQDCYVEVWIEKDALTGVISGVCHKWDLPYFSCRGYTSQSELWRAARRIRARSEGKEGYVLHLGDHDPSGLDMTRDIEDRLNLFGAFPVVRRLALNMDQIEELQPPPNPAKVTDSRFQAYVLEYGDESWELDALEPGYMVRLIEEAVEAMVDNEAWDAVVEKEEDGKDRLEAVAERWDEEEGED